MEHRLENRHSRLSFTLAMTKYEKLISKERETIFLHLDYFLRMCQIHILVPNNFAIT
jgi:hypothetical protein